MKLLHTSEFRTTSDSNAKVDTVERYTFPDGQPYREIAVKVDADMTVDEARRLIADLQHAIALAEEFDAPEREDVSTEDQPKPREETCGAGVEWSDGRRVCELNEGHDGRHKNDDLLWWSDDREQAAASGDQPKPRKFPIGSLEPGPDVTRVRSAIGAEFVRNQGFADGWMRVEGRTIRADYLYSWDRINGYHEDGHDLSEVLADSEAKS